MAKDKDPAFLFYSKDWIQGTAELMPEEKGVLIDLLCHQHQEHGLPCQIFRLARIVGLGLSDFEKIWLSLSPRFELRNDRLYNRKLDRVMTERSEKGHKNTIIGKFASLMRAADLSKKHYLLLRSKFNVDEFLSLSTEDATERLTEWFNERLKSIEDGTVNENEIVNEDMKEGAGRKQQKPDELVFPYTGDQFMQIWSVLRNEKKWKKKSTAALQASLQQLGEVSENEAVQMMKNSIAGEWQGLFPTKTNKSYGRQTPTTAEAVDRATSMAAEAIAISRERARQSQNSGTAQS